MKKQLIIFTSWLLLLSFALVSCNTTVLPSLSTTSSAETTLPATTEAPIVPIVYEGSEVEILQDSLPENPEGYELISYDSDRFKYDINSKETLSALKKAENVVTWLKDELSENNSVVGYGKVLSYRTYVLRTEKGFFREVFRIVRFEMSDIIYSSDALSGKTVFEIYEPLITRSYRGLQQRLLNDVAVTTGVDAGYFIYKSMLSEEESFVILTMPKRNNTVEGIPYRAMTGTSEEIISLAGKDASSLLICTVFLPQKINAEYPNFASLKYPNFASFNGPQTIWTEKFSDIDSFFAYINDSEKNRELFVKCERVEYLNKEETQKLMFITNLILFNDLLWC